MENFILSSEEEAATLELSVADEEFSGVFGMDFDFVDMRHLSSFAPTSPVI